MNRTLGHIALAVLVGLAAGYVLHGCLDAPPDIEGYERRIVTADSLRAASDAKYDRLVQRTETATDSLSALLVSERAEKLRLRRAAASSAAEADAANERADELLDAYERTQNLSRLELAAPAPADCPEALAACTTARRATVAALADEQAAHASTGRELLLVTEQASVYESAYDSLRLGVVPDLRQAFLHSEEAREISYEVGYAKGKQRGRIEAAVVTAGLGILVWRATK